MRSFRVVVLVAVLALSSAFSLAQSHGFGVPKSVFPNEGFVPRATVAVAIAEAVLVPVYGKRQIASERPFKAELSRGVWDVTGSVKCDPPGPSAPEVQLR